jgi:hypothetical protein
MESSELPLTKWPALGGAVNVFMMNHWQGQCQNPTANGLSLQFICSVPGMDGISCKSTAGNQLGRCGSESVFFESRGLLTANISGTNQSKNRVPNWIKKPLACAKGELP